MHHGASHFRQVTLKIPGVAITGNTGQNFTFTDQGDIRYARVQMIEAYASSALTHSQPEVMPVVSDLLFPKMTLVLETNDPDDITMPNGMKFKGEDGRFQSTSQTTKWLPFTRLNCIQSTNGVSNSPFVRWVPMYKDLYITWTKSFVQFAPGGPGNITDIAVVLGVYYTFLNEHGKAIKRT